MPDGLIHGLIRRDRAPVLLTTDTVGGVWRYTLDLADGLQRRGVATRIATLGPAPSSAQRGEAAGLGLDLSETELPLDWTAEDADALAASAAGLRDLAQRIGAASVHLHAPALAGSTRWGVPVVAVAHSCTATWWRAVRVGPLPTDFAWRANATAAGLQTADAVISPTRAHADAMRSVYGDRPIEMIHNGAALTLPNATRRRSVLTAGRLWDEGKNIAALDRVAPTIDAPIFAAGPVHGPNGAAIELPGLHRLGSLDPAGMAAAYAGASVFTSLARYEPFGLSVLEAALAGMRLVLADIPSFRELWGGVALFTDEANLAATLRQALDATGDHGALERARRYTIDAMVTGTLAVHERLSAPRLMRIVYFTHSLASCWNHGNAHFLRGVLRELIADGHDVAAYEPKDSWSLQSLREDAGTEAAFAWQAAYPELRATDYAEATDPAMLAETADLVLVHEWNPPALVARLGQARRDGARYTLLFHDTHHRAVSDPDAMRAYDLSGYDGVLAFGETLAEVYRGWGWDGRVFVWHEAADIRLFHPPESEIDRHGAVWIGNWGDGERTAELEEFLLAPAAALGLPLTIYGVRYPDDARALLARYGVDYRGWLPNHRAPEIFASHLLTIHVPRRYYATQLPGIPTIRVFEALACGIPLVSAPWEDREGLFTPAKDYLVARNGAEMRQHLSALMQDAALRRSLAAHGLATIRARHTCRHRARELLAIVDQLRH